MNKKALIFAVFLSGCTCFDIDRTHYGKHPYTRRAQWTPPDPCNYETFEREFIEPQPGECVGPVDISYLIDYALCHNPLTQNSWALAKAAYYNFQASKGALYPSLTATVSETFEINSSTFNSNVPAQSSTLTGATGFFLNNSKLAIFTQDVSLNWLLLDFGGRCGTIEAAKFSLVTANWTHNQTIQNVMFSVIANYYKAEQAIELREANEYSLNDATETLKATEAQFEAGIVTKLDVLQAKSNYTQAEYNLVQSRANEEIALATLAQAAGYPPNTCLTIQLVENIEQKNITEKVEELIAVAKGSRNDLAAYFSNYKQYVAQERVAFSNILPQVFATGDLNKSQFSAGFGSASNVSAAIGVQWNFFNGFENQYLYYSSKLQAKAAYASWREQEQNVILEVVTAYNQYNAANENLYFSEEYYRYTSEAFKAALLGYKSGLNTILDVLTNQTNLAQARAQLIDSRTNWLTSLANITYSTGMLHEGGYVPCQDCCN